MRKVTLSHRMEYAGLMFVIFVLRLMPLSVASGMMGRVWRFIAPKLSRQKRAMEHLRLCFPEKSEKELYVITQGMWDNLGRTFVESLLAEQFLDTAASLIEITSEFDDLVEKIQTSGAVIVSLHSGNWELGGVVSSKYGFKAAVTIQKLKNPLVHDYVVSRRASTFQGGIYAKGDKAGTRIMSTIKGGTVAAIMGDLRDGRGVKVPFFGRPAPTNTFPARLSLQQNVPLIAVQILRKDGVQFKINAELIEVPRTDDLDADILSATRQVQQVFEGWIRAKPEQWMWAHKRWG
ncbi:lysophospholipid acyltransferase family protein [Cohaesibacter celericrescens]|uniref:lysophospholipid acyltransferase family protein n=1 Tax=Cohaesibacter celericrescens TaxID=2067669 RepID=UPI003565A3FB